MKRKTTIGALICVSLLAIAFSTSPKAKYIWSAYFFPGSDGALLRGYPRIYPPDEFSGTWTDYSYRGRPLATRTIVNGEADGRQVYFDDNGDPYLIRYIKNGEWDHDELERPLPAKVKIPWYFPQRWINRGLDRLALWDKLFPSRPTVAITTKEMRKRMGIEDEKKK